MEFERERLLIGYKVDFLKKKTILVLGIPCKSRDRAPGFN